MEFDGMRINLIKPLCYLMQLGFDPVCLTLENSNSSKDKVLLVWIVDRARVIKVQQMHNMGPKKTTGCQMAACQCR